MIEIIWYDFCHTNLKKPRTFEFHLNGPKLVELLFRPESQILHFRWFAHQCLTELLVSAHDTTVSNKIVP